MLFLRTAIPCPDCSADGDIAGEEPPRRPSTRHHRPVATGANVHRIGAAGGAGHEVEEKEAVRLKGGSGPREEREQSAIMLLDGAHGARRNVIHHFSDRDDRVAPAKGRGSQATDRKSRPRRPLARHLDHRPRLIDAVDVEPSRSKTGRERSSAAPELDHSRRTTRPVPRQTTAKQPDDLRRGAPRVVAEAGVVNVREILGIEHSVWAVIVPDPRVLSTMSAP
jgi:hypothetical protein